MMSGARTRKQFCYWPHIISISDLSGAGASNIANNNEDNIRILYTLSLGTGRISPDNIHLTINSFITAINCHEPSAIFQNLILETPRPAHRKPARAAHFGPGRPTSL